MTPQEIAKGLGLFLLGCLGITLIGMFGFVLLLALIIAAFCGVRFSVTKKGERIGYIRWGQFYRDGDNK